MIKSFSFINFKSYEKAELNLEKITTIIGTNSSGKSNAIEGIKILSELAAGLDILTVLDGTKNINSIIRGGSKGCCRTKNSSFALGCRIDYDQIYDLYYEIKIGVSDRLYIEAESLKKIGNDEDRNGGEKIFKTKQASGESADIKVEYSNGKRGMNPDLLCVRSAAVLPQMKTKMPTDSVAYIENLKCIEMMQEHLKNILFLEPLPSEMRDYVRINDTEIKVNGSNISAVLKKVCEDEMKKELLLKIIKEFPENEVKDISFISTDLGDVIFALTEKYGNVTERVDARRLSDGTLRCIAVITALLTEKECSLVIIEELDNGIHPGRVKSLVEHISEIAEERNIDVMMTTHNAVLLNTLSAEGLSGVSVVYRDKKNGTSKFVPFIDVENFARIMAAGGLGDAVVNGKLLQNINHEGNLQADDSWMEV